MAGLRQARRGGKCQGNVYEVPMSIDQSTAAKVAKLARIKVEDDALPALASEFNTILGFIEQLNEVDVEGVEPMTSVTPQHLKRRQDVSMMAINSPKFWPMPPTPARVSLLCPK